MSSQPNMEAFQWWIQEADHDEAIVIDRHFDSPEISHLDYAQRVIKASEAAHEELIQEADGNGCPTTNGAIDFGYQTARDAKRWLMYRDSYLYDNLDSLASSDDQRLELEEEQESAADMLTERVPIYFEAYATLEAIRHQRELRGKVISDPLRLEKDLALTGLVNALDDSLESPETLQLNIGSSTEGVLDTTILLGATPTACRIRREQDPSIGRYEVVISMPEQSAIDKTDDEAEESEEVQSLKQMFAEMDPHEFSAIFQPLKDSIDPSIKGEFLSRYIITQGLKGVDAKSETRFHAYPMDINRILNFVQGLVNSSESDQAKLKLPKGSASTTMAVGSLPSDVKPIFAHPWSPIPELRTAS